MIDEELKKLGFDNRYNKDYYELTLHLHTLIFFAPKRLWTLDCKGDCASTLNFKKFSEVEIFIKHFE